MFIVIHFPQAVSILNHRGVFLEKFETAISMSMLMIVSDSSLALPIQVCCFYCPLSSTVARIFPIFLWNKTPGKSSRGEESADSITQNLSCSCIKSIINHTNCKHVHEVIYLFLELLEGSTNSINCDTPEAQTSQNRQRWFVCPKHVTWDDVIVKIGVKINRDSPDFGEFFFLHRHFSYNFVETWCPVITIFIFIDLMCTNWLWVWRWFITKSYTFRYFCVNYCDNIFLFILRFFQKASAQHASFNFQVLQPSKNLHAVKT